MSSAPDAVRAPLSSVDPSSIARPVREVPFASSPREFARLSDAGLVALAKTGDHAAFGALTSRFNQRLYRIARSVLRDDVEAEDALQEAYTQAFRSLDSFRGDSQVLTWLTSITLNEARGRLRRGKRRARVRESELARTIIAVDDAASSPEAAAARSEARHLIERAIEELPDRFRIVFIMRDLEGCTVEETADALRLPCATVGTRLHRARRLLRAALSHDLAPMLSGAFPFLGRKCADLTQRVTERLAAEKSSSQP
jgi:RNA polymerase sigma-70 factor (ECF subfamily)